jgi:hypothetical protein
MVTFKPAIRQNVNLLIGCVGGTGSGKTYTAMRMATGMSEGKNFVAIDTEAGRALHYADQFSFDHADLHPPFSPEAYTEAIHAADKAGYPVIVVDSVSHVWAGDGGVLDMQEEQFIKMGEKEGARMASWIKPKMAHKKFVQSLLQVRAHLILCFRAEQKIEMVRENGKTVIHQKQSLTGLDGWLPVSEKNLPFELTTSLLFTADKPGIPQPIKLQEQHKKLFPLDKQVDEASGAGIAKWAKGGVNSSSSEPATQMPTHQESKEGLDELISPDQAIEIGDTVKMHNDIRQKIIKRFGSVAKIPADKYQSMCEWVNTQISAKEAAK